MIDSETAHAVAGHRRSVRRGRSHPLALDPRPASPAGRTAAPRRPAGRRSGRSRHRAPRCRPGRSSPSRPRPGRPSARRTRAPRSSRAPVFEPSSSTMPRSRERSYSIRSAASMLRATRMMSSGSSSGSWLRGRPARWRSRRSARPVEVDQPLAQIGVGGMADAHPRLVLHPSHRRLGAEAGFDGLADAAQPAGVVGEHAIGLDDLALLAADQIGLLQHLVELRRSDCHGPVEPAQLRLGSSLRSRVTTMRGSCSHARPMATPSTSLVPSARRVARPMPARSAYCVADRPGRPRRTSRPGPSR